MPSFKPAAQQDQSCRGIMDALDAAGELLRISAPVDPVHEVAPCCRSWTELRCASTT